MSRLILMIVASTLISMSMNNTSFHRFLDKISTKPLKEQFKIYHYAFDKVYDLNSETAIQRYRIFKENMKFITKRNSEQSSFQLGLGPFTDMTMEEYQQLNKLTPPTIDENTQTISNKQLSFDELADKDDANDSKRMLQGKKGVDWSFLWNSIRNQQYCGSCYAFAATAELEAHTSIFHFNQSLVTLLSPQQIIDCSDNRGCHGGWYTFVYDYFLSFGITTEKLYPYAERQQECFIRKCDYVYKPFVKVKSYFKCSLNQFNVNDNCTAEQLESRILRGPITTAIDANSKEFMHYQRGVYQPEHDDCIKVNHAVTIVQVNDQDLKVRNSYGKKWGTDGYAIIKRGKLNSRALRGCGTEEYIFQTEEVEVVKDQ